MKSSFCTIAIFFITILTSLAHAQEKSQAELDWEKQVGPKGMKNAAYAYVKDDPTLPRVLLIGDSISIGYTP